MKNDNNRNKTTVMYISNNELNDTINCLYRMKYLIDDFKHIEQFISKELKDLLDKEIQEATNLENNRLNNLEG